MTLVAAIRTRLLSISAVTDLVGERVYASVFAQSTAWPAIRLDQVSLDEPMQLRGPQTSRMARVQIDAAGTSKASADAVAEAVHGDGLGSSASGLNGFTGGIGSPPFVIQSVLPAGVRELYDAEEFKLYRISRDYLVWFSGEA